jgi:hypothetical protein
VQADDVGAAKYIVQPFGPLVADCLLMSRRLTGIVSEEVKAEGFEPVDDRRAIRPTPMTPTVARFERESGLRLWTCQPDV